MRKLRLIKVVVPEIVAYSIQGSKPMKPEYECSCGMGVAEEYKCCPYCGAELAWERVRRPSKEFRKLLLSGSAISGCIVKLLTEKALRT